MAIQVTNGHFCKRVLAGSGRVASIFPDDKKKIEVTLLQGN